MCGFAGFSRAGLGVRESQDLALGMLAALRHRGPDGAAIGRHGELMLGHCALPFTDPAGGRQPLVTASGHVALVFNGEIYNFAELRRELLAGGAVLRTGSDTEVLAELLEREGVEALRRIRGMYAFAMHDRRTGRTVLARDPLGKKPLYYFHDGAGLIFASELGALRCHPRCPSEADPGAVADYLVLQAFPAPGTVLAGVRKVPPGAYLEWHAGTARTVVHWRPELPAERDRRPVPVVQRDLERVLRAAVAQRVHGTRSPLGVLLSGGLDSAVVAALAKQETGRAPATFSVGFTDPAFDETDAAAAVARHLGTEHHHWRLSPDDLVEGLHAGYARVDEPLADSSLLPTMLVCRMAGRHVRGVLTGDGADEMLLGYRYFQAERLLGWLGAVPRPALARLTAVLQRLPVRHGNLPATTVARRLGHALGCPPQRRFLLAGAPFQPAQVAGILAVAGEARPFARVDAAVAAHPGLGSLERSQLGIITHFLGDVILTKVDRASMLASIEARSPFLDEAVVQFCASLPVDRKLRRFTGKHLLRRVAAGMLPAATAYGVKTGFRAPIGSLLINELRPMLLDTLSRPRLDRHGLFRPAAVQRLVSEHLAGHADHARKLWALLCFQIWQDATPRPATGSRHGMHVTVTEGLS
ncbi:asparagine synthase (glutamine-hydrolyzing) [Actinoplanes teichomyceticus]|uniref:asparagine synthase (glutamine-hydrolyzing) n=1 Tax=Actinoplanes teichomyceticus TaxID=1867 RepID=A0A1B1ESM1_ACTTI|nr:asparagine synthase (glutamine-hydrolyzing) [Actinoplanes teichomyceticus]ANQ31707.1 asparagin synthetase [Actinoplanes teichomyceticus]TWG14694.1 asparagine synthase (glutamine-hydrolysing) [Actinoplanes teichomyceticus]GIF10097.1 asparagine synthetase B [Actinoplanes teichomyceticus]